MSGGITGTTQLSNAIVPTDTFLRPPSGFYSWGQCVDVPTSYGPEALAFIIEGSFTATLPGGATDTGVVAVQSHQAYDGFGNVVALAYEKWLAGGGCPRRTTAGRFLFPC